MKLSLNLTRGKGWDPRRVEKLATRLGKVSEELLEIIAKTNKEKKFFHKNGQISRLNWVEDFSTCWINTIRRRAEIGLQRSTRAFVISQQGAFNLRQASIGLGQVIANDVSGEFVFSWELVRKSSQKLYGLRKPTSSADGFHCCFEKIYFASSSKDSLIASDNKINVLQKLFETQRA